MLVSLLLFSLIPLALAVDIAGKVVVNPLPIGSKVVLDRGEKSAFVLHDGTFTIPGVAPGEHILEALIPGHTLPSTLYTISPSNEIHAQPYIPSKLPLPTTSPSLAQPLTLYAHPEDYYTPAQSMNILGLLKSPMVLMMLFSGVMMFALPKLIENMDVDPDMAKEMAETRKKMQGMQNMDFMGSLSSILAGETPETQKSAMEKAATPAGAVNTAASGNGKKRNNRR